MTTFGIIRHGSTQWNKEGRAQGSSDIPLDEDGLLEAIKLAERLSKENWDFLYSSDLLRAKQTTEIIGKKNKNIQIQYDLRLREVFGGQIEGTTEDERILKWGENWRELDLGIESTESVITRGLTSINDYINKHTNKNILIVSHGSFIIHMLKKLVSNIRLDEHLKNTSITEIIITENGWDCSLYNCTRHLREE